MAQTGSLLTIVAMIVYAGAGADTATETIGLIKEMRGRGLNIGGGLSVHLDNVKAPPNASIFERHALRFDYNGVGVRFRADGENDAYKVGLYYGEGRNQDIKGYHESNELLIPALLGYKTTALVVMSLMGVSLIVLKSLIVAKMAAVVAFAVWAKRYFGGGADVGGSAGHYDFATHASEMHPVYAEYPGDISELGYPHMAAGNYIAYAAPQEDVTGALDASSLVDAASSVQYSLAAAPAHVAVTEAVNATTQRRRGLPVSKPQAIHTYITVKRKGNVLH